jgi:hypothetical protein
MLAPLVCWTWWPQVVVGDLGYIHQETKRWLRTHWQIAVLTRLKADMQRACPYRHDQPMRCPQGQPLEWLNYDAEHGQQWYGVLAPQSLCRACWQQNLCPREFAYDVAKHETFLGMIPLNTKVGWKLVHSARSWIEAGQSFEKNQLGLDSFFLNSLALTWTISLLADSVALLRCLAMLRTAPKSDPLKELQPTQKTFEF